MSDKLREALKAARELASGWQYAGKQWDEAQEVVRLVDEAIAADDAARGTMPAAYETVESSIVGRYKVVKRNGGGFWPYCVQAGDGTMELFIGHKTQCEKVAAALQAACLDGAFMASRAADDAARGTTREAFEAWAEREGWPTDYTPDAECGIEGGPVYRDPRTHAAWWGYREGQAASRAAAPQSDPHAAHWAAIASAAEVINASSNCGPEQAAAFCLAMDRLSAALMREPKSAGPVAWLAYDGAHQLFIVGGDGPHDLHGGFPVYLAAPTEADRLDAERLDWMSEHEAHIGWNREGDLCRVWVQDDEGTWLPVCGWDKFFDTHRQAIDAAMSAQAGGKEQGS